MVAYGHQTRSTTGACLRSMAAEVALMEACKMCCSYQAQACNAALQEIVVPHIHQAFNWDCGLACVQMVLGAFKVDCPDLGILRCMAATQSVWTIDLAHLLRKFCLDVTFTTLTLGANPQYSTESFYMEHLQEDAERVNQLFQGACAAGITLERRSVELAELQALMMTGDHLIITLIDKRALGTNDVWAPEPTERPLKDSADDSGYAGHYVVISGYDATKDCFSVCDPALAIGHIRMPSAMLDMARSAFGTDEDLLIIPRPVQFRCAERQSSVATLHHHQLGMLPALEESFSHETAGSATLC